jgi:hypothetical protein
MVFEIDSLGRAINVNVLILEKCGEGKFAEGAI